MKVYKVKTQTVIVRAEAADTGGICSVLEMHHPPETGAPIHVHENEDEEFFVLEGCYRFLVGSQRVEIEQGSFIMAPRGVPHGFRCLGPQEGKVLVYFTPAGAEGYSRA
jgi:quercetin dioxygenase-like cupin family protein